MKIHLRSTDLVLNIHRTHDPVSICTIFPDTMEVNIDVSQTQVIGERDTSDWGERFLSDGCLPNDKWKTFC